MSRQSAVALILFLLLIGAAPEELHADGIQAVVTQRTHPVLIGNDLNVLLSVELDVPQSDIQATAFQLSLDGTDDLADIDSLQLFFAGDSDPAALDLVRSGIRYDRDRHELRARIAGRPFGGLVPPTAELTIESRQHLSAGKNRFWLSCRLRSTANLSHQVVARCTQIDTTQGSIQPRDDRAHAGHRIGIALRRHFEDGVHTSRIPALTATPRGTLLCVYDMRRRKRRDLQEDIDIGLSRSTDGGQSWEPVRVIMDMGEYGDLGQEQNGCSDPGIVVDDQTGEIFCAAVWMHGRPGHHQWRPGGSAAGYEIGESAQFLMVSSEDDGLTWTAPVNLTRQLKQEDWILIAPSPQSGLTLSDGTLVLPGEGRDEQDRRFSTLITSSDHGRTWSTASADAIGNTECQVVELSDGSLMLNGRTKKHRSVWITRDRGRTWQPHATHRSALVDSHCNGSLVKLTFQRDGREQHLLCFANPHSPSGRVNHTIQLSFDEGQTWPEEYHLLLDEGRGNGYPSMTQVDENHLGIVYEGSQAHLVFEKISVDELLAGAQRP